MKSALLLLVLSIGILSCKKETKTDTSPASDTAMVDTIPSDTMPVPPNPMPSDTIRTTDTAMVKKMDTAKTSKK